MEAWRDELYHWGIKGMKWKKHKKSAIEKASDKAEMKFLSKRAKEAEIAYRSSASAKESADRHETGEKYAARKRDEALKRGSKLGMKSARKAQKQVKLDQMERERKAAVSRLKQDRINRKTKPEEKRAKLIENARRSRDEAEYKAEYGHNKSRNDQKVADKNAAKARENLRKANKANSPELEKYSETVNGSLPTRKFIAKLKTRKKKDKKKGTITYTRKTKGGTATTVDKGKYRSTKYRPNR